MSRQTHAERILERLRLEPNLDDDELSVRTGIAPRQTVNLTCRRLAAEGRIERTRGPSGKIVNRVRADSPRPPNPSASPPHEPGAASTALSRSAPSESATSERAQGDARASRARPDQPRKQQNVPARTDANVSLVPADLGSTLFVLPCSGSKVAFPGRRDRGPSLADGLPAPLAQALASARAAVRERARVDETTLVPAWERYGGSLYQAARPALASALRAGRHVVILSGGYGIVRADEPIGDYDAIFRPAWWPRGLLEAVLAEHARHLGVRAVRAFASESTSYRKIVEGVDWTLAGVDDTLLLMPASVGAGAMVKAPRAQGEALAALLQGRLRLEWASADGVRLTRTVLELGARERSTRTGDP